MPALGKSGTLRIFVLSDSIILLSRHTKSSEPARRLDLERVDIVHARAGRPLPHGHLESLHRISVAFGDHLNAAVVLIANVTLNALTLGGILDEVPESYALHTSLDDEAAPNEHAELYMGTKKGRQPKPAPFC